MLHLPYHVNGSGDVKDFAGAWVNVNEINPDLCAGKFHSQALGQQPELVLLLSTDPLKGIAVLTGPTGLDFDQHQRVLIARQNINLAKLVATIPLDNLIADRYEVFRRPIFTRSPKREVASPQPAIRRREARTEG